MHSLALSPGEVYALLQGQLTGGLAELELMPTDTELGQISADDAEADLEETLSLVKKRLAEEPLLALSLRGIDKGQLLNGIFTLWAEEKIRTEEKQETTSVSGLLQSWLVLSGKDQRFPPENGLRKRPPKVLFINQVRNFMR